MQQLPGDEPPPSAPVAGADTKECADNDSGSHAPQQIVAKDFQGTGGDEVPAAAAHVDGHRRSDVGSSRASLGHSHSRRRLSSRYSLPDLDSAGDASDGVRSSRGAASRTGTHLRETVGIEEGGPCSDGSDDEEAALLAVEPRGRSCSARVALEVLVVFSFFVAGATFLGGSVLFLYPNLTLGGNSSDVVAALLFTVGSVGFLLVDVREFHMSWGFPLLRANVGIAVASSTAYLLGSIGMFPSVDAWSAYFAPGWFLAATVLNLASAAWKIYRILCGGNEASGVFRLSRLWREWDSFTQGGVEISAGIGACIFFCSNILYVKHATDMSPGLFLHLVSLWISGSSFFLLSAAFLVARCRAALAAGAI